MKKTDKPKKKNSTKPSTIVQYYLKSLNLNIEIYLN